MATEPILAALDVAEVQRRHGLARSSVLSDYWSLTKPEVNFLIAVTTAAGFWMGAPASLAHFPWTSLLHALVGTVLVASGAAMRKCGELRAGRSHPEESSGLTLCGSESYSPFLAPFTWRLQPMLSHPCCRSLLYWAICSCTHR